FWPGEERVWIEAPWGPWSVRPALGRTLLLAARPNAPEVCAAPQDGPRVVCFGPGGAERTLTWPLPEAAPRASRAAVRAWRDSVRVDLALKLDDAEARRVAGMIPAADPAPPHGTILVDVDGNVWVADEPGRAPVRYRVFDRQGRPLGLVDVPPLRLLHVGTDRVVGVHTDDLDVQQVRVHVLHRGAPPGSAP
ncbi:MAG: hypothetical protein D6701_04375, partial [Gemmatimonadetes bacterium]